MNILQSQYAKIIIITSIFAIIICRKKNSLVWKNILKLRKNSSYHNLTLITWT